MRNTLPVNLLNRGGPVEAVAALLGNSPAIVVKHHAPPVALSSSLGNEVLVPFAA
jgi:hypothetical protein